jgi:regulator of protease activity HflC (stomatin/prohibitin superfamily)
MLYKFKSKSTGDVIMLQPNGRRLLEIIGKDLTSARADQGILLPGQMPAAIAALEEAIAQEEAQRQAIVAEAQAQNKPPPQLEAITLRQRALPFIDMLRRSAKDGHEVVWGV